MKGPEAGMPGAGDKPPERRWSLAEHVQFIVSEKLGDKNEHLNYENFLSFFRKAQEKFLNDRYVGVLLVKQDLILVVRAVHVEYHQEVLPGQKIDIYTQASPGETSITFRQEMFVSGAKPAATVEYTIVVVKDKNREETAAISGEIRERILAGA